MTTTYTLTATNTLGVASLSVTISVSASQSDLEAPQVVSVILSPSTVTLDGTGATVAANIHVTDRGTGVSRVGMALRNPVGSLFYCYDGHFRTETANDGVWTCAFSIPAGAAAGVWSSVYVEAEDYASNLRIVRQPEVGVLSAGISVINPQSDLEAPQILNIILSPSTVTLNGTGATVTANIHVTDIGTGTSFVGMSLKNPVGSLFYCHDGHFLSGSVTDGVWACTFTIPTGAAAGVWAPLDLETYDFANNSRILRQPELGALSGGISVVNSQSDLEAPQIVSIGLSPSTVTLSGTGATVTANIHVTDGGGGVSRVGMALKNPVGSLFYCYDGYFRSGTASDGVWACTFTIPAGAAAGDWAPLYAEAEDYASNVRIVRQPEMGVLSAGITVVQ